jgi:thiol-disulfide isomerase/thioredoxin
MPPPPKPIWQSPPFASVFADAFVQGTELDGGHVVYSCQALLYALAALTHDAPEEEEEEEEEDTAKDAAKDAAKDTAQGTAQGTAKDTAQGAVGGGGGARGPPSAAALPRRPRTSKAALSLFSDADLRHLTSIAGLLRGCAQVGAAQVEDGESFLKFLKEFIDRLAALEAGQLMVVPGGWDGENSRGTLVYIIERGSDGMFSFVTCNGGCAGIEYHPSTGAAPASAGGDDDTTTADDTAALAPSSSSSASSSSASSSSSSALPAAGSAPKLKFKTCVRIDNIPAGRITDKALWTAMMSQWMKKPEGEYQRAEVIYDVLLPWLAGGRLLPDALAETKHDPRSTWRTPCRSGGSSSYKSLWEAVRYIGLHLGLRPAQLKQLSFCVRTTFLDLVTRDLDVMADPKRQFEQWDIPESLQDAAASDGDESKGQDGAGSSRDPLLAILESAGPLVTSAGASVANVGAAMGGKPIALYFSGHWCGPCRQFTPLLKEFYTSIKREGKPFELVFVSHDRSPQEFAEYFATMPWHALPFSTQGRQAAQRLVQKYRVSGVPTLVLFRDLETAEIITAEGRELVQQDPRGEAHPWLEGVEGPPREMSSADLKLVRYACETTARAACKERTRHDRLSVAALEELHSQMDQILDAADALPPAPDVAMERASTLPPVVSLSARDIAFADTNAFGNMELLSGTGMDAMAGAESSNHVTDLANILEVPESVTSVEQALVALLRCEKVVDQLLKRAGDASASSRLASQHQIIELIAKLFTRVLPIPKASTVAIAFGRARKLESEGFGANSDDENEDGDEAAPKETAAEAVQKQGGANAEAAKQAQEAAAAAAAVAQAAAKDQEQKEQAAKEAAAVEARQMSAMTLLAAWPHLDFDVVVGALEVNGDSMSIAGNWLLDKDNATARTMLATKRQAMQAKAVQDTAAGGGSRSSGSSGAASEQDANASLTEEDLFSAGASDQYGPKRSAAAAFRERLMRGIDKNNEDSKGQPSGDESKNGNAEDAAAPTNACIWAIPLDRSSQLRLLHVLYKLLSTFGGMWQAIELPNRPLDSERTCVTMCAMSIFDAVLRMPAGDKPLVVSSLLSRDGGYATSTAVCQDNRAIDDMSSTMQLHRPWAQRARSRALDYLSAMRRSCAKTLFLFRQPQKIELRKYSSTCVFLKRMLARCGFELIPRNARRPPPEIEALCHWLFEPETDLATKHPEFGLMRDMAVLGKFLLTMQTREHELMSRRQDRGEAMRYVNYSFTFEEGGRKSTWDLRGGGMRWEVVGFRGAPDKDTADIDCFAFGNRRLFFGEGLVCHSPADAALAVGTPMPTEDDVLHADDLPLFGDTLSREESEMLHGFLTVDYARIPLVLNFFAEKDRVTYLFNTKLQSLLLAVIFEAGPWVPNSERTRINRVPERQTYSQKAKEEFQRMQDARLPPNRRLLGTPRGLLLNELYNAPGATLGPILSMVCGTVELMTSDVYSPDASFILFMATLAIDVESFIDAVLYDTIGEERGYKLDDDARATLEFYRAKIGGEFLRGTLLQALQRWRCDAEDGNDMPTACVIHAYIALVHFNARAGPDFGLASASASASSASLSSADDGKELVQSSDLDSERIVTQILGSLSFVRNWHGFGMGTLRSNMLGSENGGVGGTERLVRFMQAHGIDTSRVKLGSLANFIKGGRPVYLRVGRETVRAPTFASPDMDPDRIPPADVPEHRIFSMLQKQARTLVGWLDRSQPHQLDRQLNKIMAVALKNPSFAYEGWSKAPGSAGVAGAGLYVASDVDLRFSVQSAEVLWRNDELRPVPDSMVQFNDYDSMFGKEPLHCGIVKRQKHRLWVHLVGKEYDLLEWDEPPPLEVGIGMPGTAPAGGNGSSLPPYWTCAACTMFNQPDPQTGMARANCGMCDSPRPPSKDLFYAGTGGTKHDREFDPYSEEPHPHASENWVLELLKPVILHYFPADKPMEYKLLLPHDPLPDDASEAHLIGLANPDKGNATWKEFVCYKYAHHGGVLHVFNLLSHGRKVYRSLIYSSHASLSRHSLPVNVDPRSGPVPDEVRASAGDLKEYRKPCASLQIVRQSKRESGGRETLLPSRLLQGVVPSSLLDAYRFWQDDKDMVIRGDPVDSASQWFNFAVEIHLPLEGSGSETARILRTPLAAGEGALSVKAKTAVSMLRSSSTHLNTEDADEVDEATLMLLVQLGYSPAAGRMALRKCNRDVEQAAMWLMDEANTAVVAACDKQHEMEGPMNLSAPPLVRTASQEGRAKNLENEGFESGVVRHALDLFEGESSVEALARTWLSDPNNATEIAAVLGESSDRRGGFPSLRAATIDSAHSASQRSSSSPRIEEKNSAADAAARRTGVGEAATAKKPPTEQFELVDLMAACNTSENTALRRIATILRRVEDISHILVWAKLPSSPSAEKDSEKNSSTTEVVDDLSTLDMIDLPRLKMRLRPRLDSTTGKVRLHLLDQSGWFLSDRCVDDRSFRENTIFTSLLAGLQHSIVIENDMSQLQVLLANHDVYRPPTRGLPFTTDLVFARGSVSWIEVMERRYYLFPIHTSKTFLQTTSLASMMYLILLKMLHRDYAGAAKLVGVVAVDTLFTAEERWVFDLIQTRTADDYHPDAHAVRLKLLLAVHLFSDNEIQWRVHVEADAYLAKRPGISAACRLSEDEELDVLTLAKQGTPRIKNQSRLLAARKSAKRAMEESDGGGGNTLVSSAVVEMEGANVRVGGQPWWKLGAYSPGHIVHRIRSRASFVQYKDPEGLKVQNLVQDEELFNLIWKDEIMADEENGANRQLGILFLYKLAIKEMQCLLLGDDVTRSFVEIFTRMFHLKLARWGREQVNEGEEQVEPSREMIKLSVLLRHPDRAWQALPKDPDSKRLLSRGLEVNSRMMNSQWAQMLKIFYNFWEREFTELVSSPEYEAKLKITRSQMDALKTAPLSVKTTLGLFDYGIVDANTLPAIVDSFGRKQREISPIAGQSGRSGLSGEQKVGGASNNDPAPVRMGFTPEELRAFCLQPLQQVGLEDFIVFKKKDGEDVVASDLPFDVSRQRESKTPIAVDMIKRMGEDMAGFAKECSESEFPEFTHLSKDSVEAYTKSFDAALSLGSAIKSLEALIAKLEFLASSDSEKMDCAASEIVRRCQTIRIDRDVAAKNEADAQFMFKLKRLARQRPIVDIAFVTSSVMCVHAYENLLRINPFLSRQEAETIIDITVELLLRTSRVIHANRTASGVRSLIKSLKKLDGLHEEARGLEEGTPSSRRAAVVTKLHSLSKYIQIKGASLAKTLASKRFFMDAAAGSVTAFAYDPRFLVFEYIFDIVLRQRQIEIVNSFRTEASRDGGGAMVQQMIMGAGKTTVVGPLLTLMLADGDRLVTQVMPGALLEQTRTVLRSRFSSTIMPKRVYTLEFERSVEDSVRAVDMIWKKMDSARRSGYVIVSSPESIKSFMLKFVEHMHAVEESDVASLRPGKSVRDNEIVAGLRDRMVAKSDMADAIVRVLDMWKAGVLIMDEVDVLLHPLRSELNFPIGHKYPIDLSGYRWDLPIFLIDAIFAGETGSLTVESILQVDNESAVADRSSKMSKLVDEGEDSSDDDEAAFAAALAMSQGLAAAASPAVEEKSASSSPDSPPSSSLFSAKSLEPEGIISDLLSVLRAGTRAHAFMHAPHLVLMDTAYYNVKVKPVMARWAMVWLRAHFIGRCSVQLEILIEYLCGVDDMRREEMRPVIEGGLSAEARKLLNLAADWIQTLLPHVLAKINRVSFGLLTPADLATCDPHMPYSRRVMAVPFVGKDVPSRASEVSALFYFLFFALSR